MQLDEFRAALKIRCAKHHTDAEYVPSFMFPRIMESAESGWPLSNRFERDGASMFDILLQTSTELFGGFCGWADTNGVVYPFTYAGHERFRYCYTPDHREAEQVMAHVSTTEASIEDMMSNLRDERLKTKRMTRGILTFCHSVNENVFWHEALLRRNAADFHGLPWKDTIETATLSKYLHEDLPKHLPGGVPAARPYWRIANVIQTTNQYAVHERDIIKPYTQAEMVSRFKVQRWFSNYYEAGCYDSASNMPVAEFQKRLATIGY